MRQARGDPRYLTKLTTMFVSADETQDQAATGDEDAETATVEDTDEQKKTEELGKY